MIQTNLYDSEIYFGIIFQRHMTLIIEPENWNKIQQRIPRDKKWYSFWSDFLEDKYGMRFTFIKTSDNKTGGGELLMYIHDTVGLGPDTDVYFQVGYKNKEALVEINTWRINLNEYDCENPGGVLTSIEKMPMQAKLKARMSSPCSLNAYVGVDGNVLQAVPTYTLRMHSKTLLLKTQGVSPSPQRSNDYHDNFGTGNPLVLQPDQSNLTINQLPNVYTQQMGLLNIGSVAPSTPSPIGATGIFTDFLSQMNCQFSGLLTIEVTATFNWWYWNRGFEYTPAGGADEWKMTPRLVVQRFIAGTWTNVTTTLGAVYPINSSSPGHVWPAVAPTGVLPIVTGADRNTCNKTPLSWNETYTNVSVEAGDNVYVHLIIEPIATFVSLIVLTTQADNYLGTIKYTQLTTTPGTTAPAYRPFDVLNQFIENITGFKNHLISSFFSEGGDGWNYLLANGYGIRNFGGPAYFFKKDFDSLLTGLANIHCLGSGIRRIDQEDYLVVEKASDFFKNLVIGRYTTYEWVNKDASELRYNKVTLGYDKYEGLNIQQQDDYCTQGDYILQNVKTNDNILERKSSLIASAGLIETQRRNQFLANPQQTLSNDEDIFIVATSENPVLSTVLTVQYDGLTSIIYFNKSSMALQKGDTFVIISSSGGFGTNDGVTFTIVAEVSGYPIIGLDAYTVTPTPVTDITFNNELSVSPSSPDQIFAERDQPFEICANTTDASTIYNGRLALKNILYNWRCIIGVGLYSVDTGSADYQVSMIKTRLVKMNSLFTHKFNSTASHTGNIGTKTVVELDDIFIKDYLREGSNVYSPNSADCKVKLGWNDMNTTRKALTGELGDVTKDYGGLELQDCFGVWWFCHVMDISYDIQGQFAKLQVQKVREVL